MTIVIALVVGAVGFFAGMQFSNYQRQQSRGNFAAQGGFNGSGGTGQFGTRNGNTRRPGVIGNIISLDNTSATVKMQDGSTKIVILSSSTSYVNTSSASKSDLKIGQTISAFGTDNSDGTLTATNVQLNPMFRGVTGGAPRQ